MVFATPTRRALRRLALSLLFATALLPLASAKPADWAAEIDQLTQSDATHPPASGAIVFVGSSSIRRWTTLTQDFPNLPVINRGFGGSELADSTFYADRIVLAYKPRTVVLYAGENDLWNGKTARQVAADFREFRLKLHAALPNARLFYLSIKESPARARIREQIRQANALIAAECAPDLRCRFIDVGTPMLDSFGHPRPDLFVEDQLHLNPDGYAIWIKILTPLLSL